VIIYGIYIINLYFGGSNIRNIIYINGYLYMDIEEYVACTIFIIITSLFRSSFLDYIQGIAACGFEVGLACRALLVVT